MFLIFDLRRFGLHLTLTSPMGQVNETFTPPPPSNWGLPDGEVYQYGSFPKLDTSLFGKIREPKEWPKLSRKTSQRMSRRASGLAHASERAFFAKTLAVSGREAVSPKNLIKATRRGVRGLESAIVALSSPFSSPRRRSDNGPKTPVQNAEVSFDNRRISDVTMPSTLDLDKDDITAAEEVVMNARRKQAILVGVIVQLQSAVRAYLARKHLRDLGDTSTGPSSTVDKKRQAEKVLRKWLEKVSPCYLERRRFLKARNAAIIVQTCIRFYQVKTSYLMLFKAICRLQSRIRGIQGRVRVREAMEGRLNIYRQQIFTCWRRAKVPLSYRSTFWPLLGNDNKYLFARVTFAESELSRLWLELQFGRVRTKNPAEHDEYVGILQLSTELGMDVRVLSMCRDFHVDVINGREGAGGVVVAVPKRRSVLRRGSSRGTLSLDHLTWERSQVYDNLSLTGRFKPNELDALFETFGVAGARKKKAALAEAIWEDVAHVDASIQLLKELFPELSMNGILLSPPSKKAVKRFRLSLNTGSQTPPLQAMLAHVAFDNRVRQNNAEVARLGLLRIPDIAAKLSTKLDSKTRSSVSITGEEKIARMKRLLSGTALEPSM